jgi:hypothetical protein
MPAVSNKAVPLSKLQKHLPLGTKVCASTINRWITKGVFGKKLAAELVGGRYYTTPANLRKFLDELKGVSASGAGAA